MTHDDAPPSEFEEKSNPEMVRLQRDIERTRSHMAGTIGQLESRLDPAEVREKISLELQHVEDRVRVVVGEQLSEAKTLVQAELSEAKSLLREEMNEAEQKLKRGLGEARDAIKTDLKEAVTGAKRAARAATLGKVEDLATTIGDKMNETRETLVDTVRNNPVPAAIMGVGLVWLLMNRSKSASAAGRANGGKGAAARVTDRVEGAIRDTRSSIGNVAHQVSDAATRGLHQAGDAAQDAVHRASETTRALANQASDAATHLAEQASDTATALAEGAKQSARRVEQGFTATLEENPLAVGAAALALGAVVGFSLPRTHAEDSLMGEARDRMLHQAGDAAQEAASSISHVAEQALEKTKSAAYETLTPSE